jgi:hypothetical protein
MKDTIGTDESPQRQDPTPLPVADAREAPAEARPPAREADDGGEPLHTLVPREAAAEGMAPAMLEHQIAHWTQVRALLTTYISQHMKEGIDYYTLLIGGKPSKPSLSKAGSEKFLSLFMLQARFRRDEDTWEMLGRPAGVLCYVCALYTKAGAFVGEGRGAREVAKDKDINKAIKMAQKSAQIDAILRTGSLSDYFTQDLEEQAAQVELTVQHQKRRIVALLKQLGIETVEKAGYEEAVRQYTALALVPDNFPEIIHRLARCVQERGPDAGGPAHRDRARSLVP